MIEGNRRVDWPKELLVHLNSSVASYIAALNEFTDRPENQKFHFLLTSSNTSESGRKSATRYALSTPGGVFSGKITDFDPLTSALFSTGYRAKWPETARLGSPLATAAATCSETSV